ncbi:MAG TPA: hypothetical protein VEZ41_01205 [Allosphingosinicella sp.]|nr:hypothetical protein [Allosphingosinicella sp.]
MRSTPSSAAASIRNSFSTVAVSSTRPATRSAKLWSPMPAAMNPMARTSQAIDSVSDGTRSNAASDSRVAAVPPGMSERKSSAAPPRSAWRRATSAMGPSAISAWSAPHATGFNRSGITQRIVSTGPAKPKQAKAAHLPLLRSIAMAAAPTPNSRVMPTAAETRPLSSKNNLRTGSSSRPRSSTSIATNGGCPLMRVTTTDAIAIPA